MDENATKILDLLETSTVPAPKRLNLARILEYVPSTLNGKLSGYGRWLPNEAENIISYLESAQ